FEPAFVFRKCEGCGATNVVKENWFYCALCECALPLEWNFGSARDVEDPIDQESTVGARAGGASSAKPLGGTAVSFIRTGAIAGARLGSSAHEVIAQLGEPDTE